MWPWWRPVLALVVCLAANVCLSTAEASVETSRVALSFDADPFRDTIPVTLDLVTRDYFTAPTSERSKENVSDRRCLDAGCTSQCLQAEQSIGYRSCSPDMDDVRRDSGPGRMHRVHAGVGLRWPLATTGGCRFRWPIPEAGRPAPSSGTDSVKQDSTRFAGLYRALAAASEYDDLALMVVWPNEAPGCSSVMELYHAASEHARLLKDKWPMQKVRRLLLLLQSSSALHQVSKRSDGCSKRMTMDTASRQPTALERLDREIAREDPQRVRAQSGGMILSTVVAAVSPDATQEETEMLLATASTPISAVNGMGEANDLVTPSATSANLVMSAAAMAVECQCATDIFLRVSKVCASCMVFFSTEPVIWPEASLLGIGEYVAGNWGLFLMTTGFAWYVLVRGEQPHVAHRRRLRYRRARRQARQLWRVLCCVDTDDNMEDGESTYATSSASTHRADATVSADGYRHEASVGDTTSRAATSDLLRHDAGYTRATYLGHLRQDGADRGRAGNSLADAEEADKDDANLMAASTAMLRTR
ncbi:hypothetical protein THASP1DRAFT_30377 [Thamnocephalis sphaerospora]|uniref:Membrane-associated protein n=1 Tax=Thamnocephalis sphaerospora TaxID=78915 RepID=A0A4P9XPA7_9FUNG|nr:hypothetical protein THASP1DRAFT_30377 [Thamnocephalis sphaerospora]|eukprot:RKP07816.1 hypothetical protein THASP1DRAFT_30377 [Thamnocephalis sphaerospora]